MLKVKVIHDFIDKHTDQKHQVGEIMEITEERKAELDSASVQLIQVEEPAQKNRSRKKGTE